MEGEPRRAVFLALLWLTRTTGSLRFWPSNSHGECFPVATSTGDTVRGETGGLLLHQTVVGLAFRRVPMMHGDDMEWKLCFEASFA